MEPGAQPIQTSISKSTSATPESLSSQVEGADTVEVNLTVANAQIDCVIQQFGLTVNKEEKRYIYFLDN